MMQPPRRGFINLLQEFSIPLLAGVVAAMIAANADPDGYERIVHWRPFGELSLFGHPVDLHYLINDIFMVFFFGIAAKEITEACLPGGDLNPPAKAMNPLIATIGGVLGPVAVFFAGLALLFATGVYERGTDDWSALARGWGVPTATDIALAWLAARTVFGRGHPAINFLLLLAVIDDGIGLAIIAIFYGDPEHPARPAFLGLVVLAMVSAFALRRLRVQSWIPYVAVGGPLAWLGLTLARLHPALALVFIVPLMPGPRRDVGGLFVDEDEVDRMGEARARELRVEHSPLHQFEHQLKLFVDAGLFWFAFTQAGVTLADVGPMTWLVLASLAIGKTAGIAGFAWIGARFGFALPERMTWGDVWMAGYIAALGLTVALFVASAAFVDPVLLGQAKMGALLSGGVGISAVAFARWRGPDKLSVKSLI